MKLAYSSEELKKTANDIRINIVESIHCGGSGHPGGSLSIAEMMAVLYFHEMDVDEKNPKWEVGIDSCFPKVMPHPLITPGACGARLF